MSNLTYEQALATLRTQYRDALDTVPIPPGSKSLSETEIEQLLAEGLRLGAQTVDTSLVQGQLTDALDSLARCQGETQRLTDRVTAQDMLISQQAADNTTLTLNNTRLLAALEAKPFGNVDELRQRILVLEGSLADCEARNKRQAKTIEELQGYVETETKAKDAARKQAREFQFVIEQHLRTIEKLESTVRRLKADDGCTIYINEDQLAEADLTITLTTEQRDQLLKAIDEGTTVGLGVKSQDMRKLEAAYASEMRMTDQLQKALDERNALVRRQNARASQMEEDAKAASIELGRVRAALKRCEAKAPMDPVIETEPLPENSTTGERLLQENRNLRMDIATVKKTLEKY